MVPSGNPLPRNTRKLSDEGKDGVSAGGLLGGPGLGDIIVDEADLFGVTGSDHDVLKAVLDDFRESIAVMLTVAAESLDRVRDPVPLLHLTGAITDATPPPEPTAEQRRAAVQPWAWLIRRAGAKGLPLTEAGFLKRVDVEAIAHCLHLDDWYSGKIKREAHTTPVLDFRLAATAVGLLQKYGGRLRATKASLALAENPDALWNHLCARILCGKQLSTRDASRVLLLAVAGLDSIKDSSLGAAYGAFEWRVDNDYPCTADVLKTADTTLTVLRHMGGFYSDGFHPWSDSATPIGRAIAWQSLGLDETDRDSTADGPSRSVGGAVPAPMGGTASIIGSQRFVVDVEELLVGCPAGARPLRRSP
jgi:hypothetical protein